MSLLSVSDLTVTFPSEAGDVHAVRGVSFDVERRQTVCLVGESGSGKSATASAVIGLLPDGARTNGSVKLDGEELVGRSDKQMSALRGNKIGMVFQDPLSALTPMFSVGQLLSDAVRVHQKVSRKAAWSRAVELLRLVGIPDPERRSKQFPHEFSGGMRQRVVIALAIANDPDLLIADEPTTALDVTVQAQILDVLSLAQEETGAGLLLITHYLGVVAGYADDVAVMYAGRIIERAPVDELFERPSMPYTIGLLGAIPAATRPRDQPLVAIPGSPPQLLAEPTGCPFQPRCPVAIEACSSGEPAPERVGAHHLSACIRAREITDGQLDVTAAFEARIDVDVSAEVTAASDEVVLQIDGLKKSYPKYKGSVLRRQVGTIPAVRGVDLELRAGETLGLVGESGSGKSTTVLEILSLNTPQAGRVEVLGTEVNSSLSNKDRRKLRTSVQLVLQDPTGALDPRLTIYDALAEPMSAAGWSSKDIKTRVYELLDVVGLPKTAVDRFPGAFSGGQRQRITIARALALRPRVVILDEPVSALDMSVQADVLNLLYRLQKELDVAFLLIAHDLAVVRHLSDRVSVMYLGTIVETADTDELFADPLHPYTRALLSASPVPDPKIERERSRTVLTGEAKIADDDPGCVFRAQCPLYPTLDDGAQARCREPQTLVAATADHRVACHAAAS